MRGPIVTPLQGGTINALVELILGEGKPYRRTAQQLEEFFQDAGVPVHQFDSKTRREFVRDVLTACNAKEASTTASPKTDRAVLKRIVSNLGDIRTYSGTHNADAARSVHQSVIADLRDILELEDLVVVTDDLGRVQEITAKSSTLPNDSADLDKKRDANSQRTPSHEGTKVFVVHGHDVNLLNEVRLLLHELEIEFIVLQEEPSRGKTVIEKFESYADADYAIVLLTPDDHGKPVDANEWRTRARQNVVLELGYFYGTLGRDHVTAVHKNVEEIPSDIRGILNVKWDEQGSWKHQLAREMRHAGLPVDLNRLSGS
jgi:predicted nucleotide-binding protein